MYQGEDYDPLDCRNRTDGVLAKLIHDLKSENKQLRTENAELRARLNRIEAKIDELDKRTEEDIRYGL